MQKIFNIFILILITCNFLFSFYLFNKNWEIQKPLEKLSTETLVRDCEWETDTKLRNECLNVNKNYEISQLFQDMKQEDVLQYDCSKIANSTVQAQCIEYVSFLKKPLNERVVFPK